MTLADRYAAWLRQPHPARPTMAVAGRPVRQALARGQRRAAATAAAWAELEATWGTSPERVWAWSDLHLFHANILRYTGRPCLNVEAMNDTLLEAAQARVGSEDWLIFAGDISLGSAVATAAWLARCPGRKALILGNHDVDRGKLTHPDWYAVWDQFEAVASAMAWQPTSQAPALWLTHYPFSATEVPPGVLNAHGHIHQHRLEGPFINLSVEQQNLAPCRLLDRVQAHPDAVVA